MAMCLFFANALSCRFEAPPNLSCIKEYKKNDPELHCLQANGFSLVCESMWYFKRRLRQSSSLLLLPSFNDDHCHRHYHHHYHDAITNFINISSQSSPSTRYVLENTILPPANLQAVGELTCTVTFSSGSQAVTLAFRHVQC